MKLIYIASPYAGDINKNVAFARSACRYAIDQGHTPIAVHLLYPQMLDDSDPAERETGLRLGRRVLESCDELWMCGSTTSQGMLAELEAAEDLGLTIQHISHEQITGEPAPVYTIWAAARQDGPLSGQAGFLCEGGTRLFFPTQAEAEQRIHDLKSLCMNKAPAVSYRCTEYPREYASKKDVHLEAIRPLDLKPDFDPQKCEVRSRVYGNTGGHCMVGTVQFYLPDLSKPVWVSCNDEGVTITSADYMWNEDKSESWERYEEVRLYCEDFHQAKPEDAGPWLPLIKEALAYTIQQDTAACWEEHTIEVPVAWLPDAYRQKAEPAYLAWLQEQGRDISIGKGGEIEADAAFSQHTQAQPGMMELQ